MASRPSRARFCIGLLVSLGIVLGASRSLAIPLQLTDANANFLAEERSCFSGSTRWNDCSVRSYLSDRSWADTNGALSTVRLADLETFPKAFSEWSDSLPANEQWTLLDGGAAPGGAIHVTTFTTAFYDDFEKGSARLEMSWTYAGDDRDDFYWAQALYDNFTDQGTVVAPFYEMDVKVQENCNQTGEAELCPPLYPFQYEGGLVDQPGPPWPDGFFEAVTMLAKPDFDQRELTVYEGVSWGFFLEATAEVPGPRTAPLMACVALLLVGMAAVHRDPA